MADEDKQFEASEQKLRKAREDGQVVKSKDFSTAVSLVVMFSLIFKMCPFIWAQISQLFVLVYEQIPNKSLEDIGLPYLLFITVMATVLIIGPVMAVAWLVGILGDLVQIGPLFTTKPLEPKLDKLNPTKYFKNLVSMKTVFELLKNIVKVVLLGLVGYLVYNAHLPAMLSLAAKENTFAVMFEFGSLMSDFVIKASILFLVISGADYMVNRFKFLKDQKMSFKEVKDEYKNSEGDPHVKAALRQRRQEMLQRDMLNSVKTADFVATNPTHVAVALKYDRETMESPLLVAKGTELFAKKIIETAKEHNVPVIENPPVARAIYRMVDVNRQIPPELYKAVAEIIMFVYNLRKKNDTQEKIT